MTSLNACGGILLVRLYLLMVATRLKNELVLGFTPSVMLLNLARRSHVEGRTTSLEDRVNLIETHLSSLESLNISADENIISKVVDRQPRSRNIIIFNAPESDDNTLFSDLYLIKSVFDHLFF